MTEPSEYSDAKSPEISEIRSGNFANVQIRESDVLMEPKFNTPSKIADMNEKMEKQEEFNGMFSNFEGIHICEIKEKDTTNGKYVVERAKGINLSHIVGEREGEIDQFLDLRTTVKTSCLLTYVRMVDELNSKGYSFTDHKVDSIFLERDYENPSKSKISIVDAGSIANNNDVEYSWQRDVKGGLGNTLKSFFTRGANTKDLDTIIPTTMRGILNRVDSYPEAKTLLRDLETYVNGKPEDVVDGDKQKMKLFEMAYATGDKTLAKYIWEKDYSALSQYQIDIMEEHINKLNLKKNIPLMKVLRRK